MPKEKKTGPGTASRFRVGEREELLDELAENAKDRAAELVFNRPELIPYAGLVAIIGTLDASEESEQQRQSHLKRMGTLETKRLERITKAPGDYMFWDYVQVVLEPEWSKAKGYEAARDNVPRGWSSADSDLKSLKENLKPKKAE